MSYCHRNYGCRIQPNLRINGYRAVVLENERLEITVLADKGADIIGLSYKPKDIDFLWRSPIGLDRMDKTYRGNCDFSDEYEGGWQEILPTGSGGGTHKNASFAFHGETIYLPWDVEILEDNADCVAVRFSVMCRKYPFYVERIMRLYSNQSEIHFEEKVKNLSEEEFHFMWGHHPAFGAPFLSEDCVLSIPSSSGFLTDHKWKDGSVCDGAFSWPHITKDIDLSKVRPSMDGSKFMVMIDELDTGQYQLYNTALGFGVEMSWDKTVMPYLWVWMNYNGEDGYPWYKRAYVLAVEPWTSIIYQGDDGLKNAIENGSAKYMEPHGEKNFSMVFRVFENS